MDSCVNWLCYYLSPNVFCPSVLQVTVTTVVCGVYDAAPLLLVAVSGKFQTPSCCRARPLSGPRGRGS